MATSYNDIYCVDDIDPYFTETGGLLSLGQSSARRITCPRGLNPADPGNYGIDVRNWLNRNFTRQEVFNLETIIEEEISKDIRVRSVEATVTPSNSGAFKIDIRIESEETQIFSVSLTVQSADSSADTTTEAEVAVQVKNVDQTIATVTSTSQSFLASNDVRKGLIVQNTSKVLDVHYAFGKTATTSSLVIPANSQREFDPVPTGSLHMLVSGSGNTVQVRIEESY